MFRCCFCKTFGAPKYTQVLNHIGRIHSFDPNFHLTCGLDGCTATFTKFASARTHFYRKHRADLLQRDVADLESETRHRSHDTLDDCELEEMAMDEGPRPVVNCHELSQGAAAKFLLMLKEGRRLSQEAIKDISFGVVELLRGKMEELQGQVTGAMDCGNLEAAKEKIHLVFEDDHLFNPFKQLETQYLQEKYYRTHFSLLEPSERVLGNNYARRNYGSYSKRVRKEDCVYDIDLLESLQSLLRCQHVVDQITHSHERNDGCLGDFCDGSFYKSHPLFSAHPHALQIVLYYDDLELCNPLGSNTKKHKIGVFYYTLANFQPSKRSALKAIQLVAIAKSKYIDYYGIDAILQPFVASVQKLERGVVFEVNGTQRTLFGTLVVVSADNLAAHLIGGYKSLHTAFRRCRYCMATSNNMASKFTADEFQQRTRHTHALHIRDLSDYMATTYGIERDSILNECAYFHVTEGIPPDIMHDVLEGSVQYEMKLFLRHCLQSTPPLFHLQTLNGRIHSFEYGYVEIRNKPSILTYGRITSQDSQCLGQTASKLWCLARFLPLMIADWIPEDNEYYENFLLMLDIVDLTFAPVTSSESIAVLREKIKYHHEAFKRLYGNECFTPKMHYNIHIPDWLLRVGPLSKVWCMRFEAKHQVFKSYTSAINNFINIPKSLSMRHQLHMCYQMLSRDKFLEDTVSVSSGTEMEVDSYSFMTCLLELWPNFGDETVIRSTSATVSGSVYQLGCMVSYRIVDMVPQFGELIDLVSHLEHGVAFVVQLYETVCFNELYHAFEVDASEIIVGVLPGSLLDYHPLMKHRCGTSGELTVVCPKYDLM